MDGGVSFDSFYLWDEWGEEQLKGRYERHSMNPYSRAVSEKDVGDVLEYNNMYNSTCVK
jgi:hypothetical protein